MGNQADRAAGGLTQGRLILVKHGRPQIRADIPRSEWSLSEEGRQAAVTLAAKLARFEPHALFASTEIKAHDTALAMGEALGLSVQSDERFREQRADENPFVSPSEITVLIERALRDPDALVMAEETGAAARARFAEAIGRIEAAVEGPKIVVAHGRIITFWLSVRLGVDPVPLWRSLDFTSAAVLSKDGFEIVRP